jgi:hypothetical protein
MCSRPFQVIRRDVDDWFNHEKERDVVLLDSLWLVDQALGAC